MTKSVTLRTGVFASAWLLASPVLTPAHAAAGDYRFEIVGPPRASGGKDIVQVRLVHVADGKPVPDAVIFQTRADMGPAGMKTMTAPVTPLPAQGGIYRFEIEPGMTGKWALRLAAKVQSEPQTVHGTVDIDLVK